MSMTDYEKRRLEGKFDLGMAGALETAADKLKSNMVRAEGYEIRNIRLRRSTNTLHANLYKDNELCVSATLEYVEQRLREVLAR